MGIMYRLSPRSPPSPDGVFIFWIALSRVILRVFVTGLKNLIRYEICNGRLWRGTISSLLAVIVLIWLQR